jgi:hypothetical protein
MATVIMLQPRSARFESEAVQFINFVLEKWQVVGAEDSNYRSIGSSVEVLQHRKASSLPVPGWASNRYLFVLVRKKMGWSHDGDT